MPRGIPRRWRCRAPPYYAGGFAWGSNVVYLPVREVVGLGLSEFVEVYDYEIEALRLVHVEGLTTEEAAARLGVSKATFWRMLESCRYKIAVALSEGRPIKLVSGSPGENAGAREKNI
ncbi:MAG: DUF134 domain-containing protein [Desulfurococcus sp.]|uniref:DUF134 domain-containing protein n=1 Tax=Desulfurococcus sp. TaxID=51678 RepID=UPI0031612FC0